MTEIIHEMAQIQLPQELLQQVDLDNLLENFRANFKKLDGFKKVRDIHNNRDFFEKFVDWMTGDNTLEHAQFDAVEVQAEFSKAIGQLMVLSIMQSQHLERQQQQLADQQITIKAQTTSIEQHNAVLKDQHEDLAKQNDALKKLVEDFFELRGLTQEGAKKLIAIAYDVKNTRDQLLQSVENSLSGALRQIGATEKQIKTELVKAMELVSSKISEAQAEIDKKLSAQLADVRGQLVSSNEKMFSIRVDLKLAQDGVLTRIRADLESEHAFSAGVDQKLGVISKQLAVYQSNAHLKFRRLQIILGVSMLFFAGLLGFLIFQM